MLALTLSPLPAHAATTTVGVGNRPTGVAVDSSNHRVVAANNLSSTVSVFDGSAATPAVASVNVGVPPASVAVDSVKHLAFVTLPSLNAVAVVDLSAATPALLRSVTVGANPSNIAVDEVSHRVFVTNQTSGTVSRFDGSSISPVVDTVATVPSPGGIAIDSSNATVLVTSSTRSSVFRFDGSALSPTSIETSLPAGESIGVDPRTHTAFVTEMSNRLVHRFVYSDAAPTLTDYRVGNFAVAIAVDGLSGEVYVTNQADSSVSHFDGRSASGGSSSVTDVQVQDVPSAVAIDERSPSRTVYVANRRSNTISRIDGEPVTAPVITSGPASAATAGVPYTFTFTATGHPAPRFSSSLPPGSDFSVSDSGVLSGTPASAGTVTFVLTATNGIDPDSTRTITLEIRAAATVTRPTHDPSGPSTATTGSAGAGVTSGRRPDDTLAQTGQSLDATAPVGLAALALMAVGGMALSRRQPRRSRPSVSSTDA